MICESCQTEVGNTTSVTNKKDEFIQICDICLKESFQLCESCDEYVHDDNILFFQDLGSKGRNYCEDCAQFISNCTECKRDLDTKLDNDYKYVEKEIFCEICYNKHECTCIECGHEYNDLEEGYSSDYCSDECENISCGVEEELINSESEDDVPGTELE